MVGDEIVDKVEEWFVDECVELESVPVGVEELRALSVECPVVAVDVSSLRMVRLIGGFLQLIGLLL